VSITVSLDDSFGNEEGMLFILNTVGERILSKSLINRNGDTMEIDLDGISSGIYLIKITMNDKVMTERIVVLE